jgi:two-component system, NtrC family, sensor kinase
MPSASQQLLLPIAATGVTRRTGEAKGQATGANSDRQMKTSPIFGLMLLAIAVIAGLAYVDEEREGAAALADFAQEQTTLAQSLAMALSAQLSSGPHDASTHSPSHRAERPEIPSVLARYLSLMVGPGGASKPPNRLMVLLQPPDTAQFYSTDGRLLDAPEIHAALKDGRTYLRLTPAEAGRLGLPARTAMAGLSRLDTGSTGAWGIAAVASAGRERDRERWARWRLLLSVAAASSLVLSFGGLAMRNQRRELLLRHRLELADLSGQRDDRLQRAGRAATMGTLAVGVAHEISTPLGIIAARAEQLVPKLASDDRAAGSVRIILEQIDRIHRIIRGLLGLARGDRPTAEPVDPAALVAGAVALVEHRFAKAGVRLLLEVAPNLPIIHGDPRLLEHAVVNLMLNACDACANEGAVTVLARAGDGNRGLVVSVVDDGPGISPANAGRVLEPFFSTKPSGQGTGIGLAIVQEIVASHRGSLALESVLPHGTRATIKLPSSEDTTHA